MEKLMGWPVQCLISLCVTGLLMFSLSSMSSAQDAWGYFNAPLVKTYGCKVYDTEMVINGQAHGEMVWEAWAFAERQTDNWGHEVGRFPHTPRGRHRAEKACSKWQDGAEKRVFAAQGK